MVFLLRRERKKRMNELRLQRFFQENPKAALGFSGGVDSAYLLWAALRAGVQIQPYFIKTPFQPDFEFGDARRLAEQLGTEISVLEVDILKEEKIAQNPENRCYYCKYVLFGTLKTQAQKDGYTLLLDGTNASDDSTDRPGMRAARELEVRSPLRECGFTKEEIRRCSRQAGLFTWNKPAYACLATRIPQGRKITEELLSHVEKGEAALAGMGFSDFRIRVYGDAARIQLPADQMSAAVERRKEIRRVLSSCFSEVFLDLQERPG